MGGGAGEGPHHYRYFQDIAAQGGNPRVETGRAVVTFPPGFDPARRWPILIVTSTTDYHRTSPMDAEWYQWRYG
jgi:hypothetical protein